MGTIAVHGFGRIGRPLVKAALRDGLRAPASISDVKDPATLAALFEFDTNYGRWPTPLSATADSITIGDQRAAYLNSTAGLPDWGAMGVSLVVDCTGRATTRQAATAHLERGAERVLLSGPTRTLEDCDAVLLAGINVDEYDPDAHRILSMGSCTTNALAPVIKILLERYGIAEGFFSTVHAYTNTQSLTDQPMAERRDSWAATENIIPSASGAARVLKFIWPELNVTGKSYRVPVRTGSVVELNAVLRNPVEVEGLRATFRQAAEAGALKGIFGILEDEYASARIVGETRSSIVDLPLVQVLGDSFVSVPSWYDNEMGFATRLAEMAARLR